jgi:hypothetical protein
VREIPKLNNYIGAINFAYDHLKPSLDCEQTVADKGEESKKDGLPMGLQYVLQPTA